jgi:hypothetical protein
MKTKFILTGAFLCILTGSLSGQDKKLSFLFLESGVDFISCVQPENAYTRADVDPLYYEYAADRIRGLMYIEYFGVKFERRMVKNLLGVSAGLRYNRMISSIGKTSYWSDSPDFFYVHYKEESTTTEYAKVMEINQKSHYIGIPVELRIYPYKDRSVNVYYKLGASFNLKIASRIQIVFKDDSMNPYESEVAGIIESASPYFASFNLGIGLKVRKLTKPGFNLEVSVPVGIVIPDHSGFVTPQTGGGFQLMIRMPLTKTKPNEKTDIK